MDKTVMVQADFLLNRCCFLTSRDGVGVWCFGGNFLLALTLRPEALLIVFIHSFIHSFSMFEL